MNRPIKAAIVAGMTMLPACVDLTSIAGDDSHSDDVVAAPPRRAEPARANANASPNASGSASASDGSTAATAESAGAATRMYGVTLDTVDDLDAIVDALKGLPKKPTTRIVFSEQEPPGSYEDAVPAIHEVSHVMGTILDSSSMSRFSTSSYARRAREYFAAFASEVDIWEVGNEINGNWLGETDDVVEKMTMTYDLVKGGGGKTELTLFACSDSDDEHDMFRWVDAHVPSRMRSGLDYVLLSYYDGDCGNPRSDWQQVFDRLRQIFPTAGLGFGEVGAVDLGVDIQDPTVAAPVVSQYYGMSITTPGYVGGYFWWYFAEDMVPSTKRLYSVLRTAIAEMP